MIRHLPAEMQLIWRSALRPTRLAEIIIMLQGPARIIIVQQGLVVPSQPISCRSLGEQLQAELAHHNRLAVLPPLLTSLPLPSGPRRCKSSSATVMRWPGAAGLS